MIEKTIAPNTFTPLYLYQVMYQVEKPDPSDIHNSSFAMHHNPTTQKHTKGYRKQAPHGMEDVISKILYS